MEILDELKQFQKEEW